MESFAPEEVPWLSEDSKYHDGVEMGAIITVCRIKAPALMKAKIRSGNEDQLRVLAPQLGYWFNAEGREPGWSFVTLTAKEELCEHHSHDE